MVFPSSLPNKNPRFALACVGDGKDCFRRPTDSNIIDTQKNEDIF